MLKFINCIFLFIGVNKINVENFSDINLLLNDYEDVNKKVDRLKMNVMVYRAFISILFLIRPTYYAYEIYGLGEKIHYPTVLYMINVFVMYVVLLKYFKSGYFEKILFDYFVIIKKHKKIQWILDDKIVPLIIIFTSIVSIVLNVFLNYYLFDPNNVYNLTDNTTVRNNIYDLYNNTVVSVIVNFFDALGEFYGFILTLTNMFIFFLVFLKHLMDIKKQVEKLIRKYSWSKDTHHTEISTMCYEIMWIRNELENSISELEPLFVANTLLGSVSLGFIIEYGEISIFQIVSTIYWVMSQATYLIIIHLINENKSDLTKVIKKPKFALHYIRRKFVGRKFNEVVHDIGPGRLKKYAEKQYTSLSVKKEEIDLESANGEIDLVLNNVSKEDKEDDINFVMKNLSIKKGNNLIEEANKIDIDEYTIKNSSSIDWIILNTILNENWGCFEFFGFEFNGVNSLSSTIALTAGLILVTKWFLELNII